MINYLEYSAGSNKGETSIGTVFNSPFGLGNVDPNYTADRVVETAKAVTEDTKVIVRLAWTPVLVENGKLANGGKIVKVSDNTEVTDYTITVDGVITANSGLAENDEVKVSYV